MYECSCFSYYIGTEIIFAMTNFLYLYYPYQSQILWSNGCLCKERNSQALEMKDNGEFTHFDAFLLILTEIVLPSVDVISDLLLIIQLTTYEYVPTSEYDNCNNPTYNCLDYNTLGFMMMIPLILSTILMIPHWWKNEETRKQKGLTAPLLLLQCWPQYRALRILWLKYFKKNMPSSVQELRVIKGTVGNIGM